MVTKHYEWVSLSAFGTKVFDVARLVAVVDRMGDAGFEPSRYWTVDGGARLPFTVEGFAGDAGTILEQGVLYFDCGSSVEGEFLLGRRPRFRLWMRGDRLEPQAIKRWIVLSSRLNAALKPDFMTLAFGWTSPKSVDT